MQLDVTILDFSKAFDKVPHQRLLNPEQIANLRHQRSGLTHSWISAFLTGRTQSKVVQGSKSIPSPVASSVPLSSVLGPWLFFLIHKRPTISFRPSHPLQTFCRRLSGIEGYEDHRIPNLITAVSVCPGKLGDAVGNVRLCEQMQHHDYHPPITVKCNISWLPLRHIASNSQLALSQPGTNSSSPMWRRPTFLRPLRVSW